MGGSTPHARYPSRDEDQGPPHGDSDIEPPAPHPPQRIILPPWLEPAWQARPRSARTSDPFRRAGGPPRARGAGGLRVSWRVCQP